MKPFPIPFSCLVLAARLLAVMAWFIPALGFAAPAAPAAPTLKLALGHAASLDGAQITRDSRHFVSTGSDGYAEDIKLWEYRTGRELLTLKRADGTPVARTGPVFIGGTPERVIVPDSDRFLVFDLESFALAGEVPVGADKMASTIIRFDDTGELLAAVLGPYSDEGQAIEFHRLDLTKLTLEKLSEFSSTVVSAGLNAVALSGRRLFVGGADEKPLLLDPYRGEVLERFDLENARWLRGPGGVLLLLSQKVINQRRTDELIEFVDPKSFETLATITLPNDAIFQKPRFHGATAVDEKTSQVLFQSEGALFTIDCAGRKLGRVLKLEDLALENKLLMGATWGGDTNSVLLACSEPAALLEIDFEGASIRRSFGARHVAFRDVFADPESLGFYAVTQTRELKRVRFTDGGLAVTTLGAALSFGATGPDGRVALAGEDASEVRLGTLKELSATPVQADLGMGPNVSPQWVDDLFYSGDGGLVGGSAGTFVFVCDTATGAQKLARMMSGELSVGHEHIGAFRPDGGAVVFSMNYARESMEGGVAFSPVLTCFDLKSEEGDVLWEVPLENSLRPLAFNAAGDRLVLYDAQARTLQERDTATGVLLATHPLELGASKDGRLLIGFDAARSVMGISVDAETLHVVDLAAFRVVQSWRPGGEIGAFSFLKNARYVVAASADGFLKLWQRDGEPVLLAEIAFFDGGRSWVAAAPDRRFDATAGAEDRLYLLDGARTEALGSYFERFFTPRLLPRLLEGAALATAEPVAPVRLTTPPAATLALAAGPTDGQVTLELKADAPAETPLSEVRLYHNGKLIEALREDFGPVGTPWTRRMEAPLIAGENRFRLVAINRQRIESAPAELAQSWTPPEGADARARLLLVAVGIDAYANTKYNLNYAVADATGFRDALLAGSKGLFSDVKTRFIRDAEANKAAIVAALTEAAREARREDVFVFYYAGHGVMSEGDAGGFYLVPHDVPQLYGDDGGLRAKAVPGSELLELSRAIPARKQLFILDACQSAGVLRTVAQRGAAEERAIAQLARASGTHWLTASGSQQFATEFEQLGHGAFTHVLMEALKGGAGAEDGRVTVNSLKAYLETRVPEVTQQYKGSPQYPASYGYGQDFPLGVVSK